MDVDQVITTDAITYLNAMPDESVDVVITDPPYPNGVGHFQDDIAHGIAGITLATRKARKRVVFFWTPARPAPAPPPGWYQAAKAIWHKPDAGTSIKYEEIYVWDKYRAGERRNWLDYKVHEVNILDYRTRRDFYEEHPTQKPVALLRLLVRDYTNEGETVLDPFSGIGSTGIAAKQLRRHYLLLEKEEKYASIARDRLSRANPWRAWGPVAPTETVADEELLPPEDAPEHDVARPPVPSSESMKSPAKSVRLSTPAKKR